MYTAFLNDELFFSTSGNINETHLLSAQLNLQAGSAGTFTFSLAPDNVAYDSFEKLKSYVDVYRDNTLLFSGRVIEIAEDFQLIRTITCEGLLAILNDSVFRPNTYNVTLQELVQTMIDSHNSQVGADKQLTIGTITIEDEYLFREYVDYDTTISRLMDLVASYGGYMTVTKSDGVLYFDWREEIAGVNEQGINFGENLLDVTQSESATELVTILIPLGMQVTDEFGVQSRVTIESVNDGNDYLVNQSGVTEFGAVVGVQVWDDVEVPSILKSKAISWLNAQSVNRVSINVTAADLAYADSMMDYFMIGQTIHVHSDAHGIDQSFVALEQSLNLLDPTQDTMVMGTTSRGYISRSASAIRFNTQTIEKIEKNYVLNDTLADVKSQITTLSSRIDQTAEEIAISVEEINASLDSVEQQASRIEATADEITLYLEENGEKLTYLEITDEGLWIGNSTDPIKLLETNDSIQFIDTNGNQTILTLNTFGMHAPTVFVDEQLEFGDVGTAEWTIRKGSLIGSTGHNLNDLWIG